MKAQKFTLLEKPHISLIIPMFMPFVKSIDVLIFLMSYATFIFVLSVYVVSLVSCFIFFKLLSLLGLDMQMSPHIMMLPSSIVFLDIDLLIQGIHLFLICSETPNEGLEIYFTGKALYFSDYSHIGAIRNICRRVDFSDELCSFYFRTQCLCLQSRVLLHILQTIITTRSRHVNEPSHNNVALIDCFLMYRPVNLGYTIVPHMLSISGTTTRSFLYGHFVTKILRYFKVPLNEPTFKPTKSIGEEIVYSLGFAQRYGAQVKVNHDQAILFVFKYIV